jgi:hypothetical protein
MHQRWQSGAALAMMAAWSGQAATESKSGRYTMQPVEGGMVRLDTETGVMSLCKQTVGAWSCDAMPDSQQSLRDQLAKLEAENQALKDENHRLEDTFGLGEPKKDGGPDKGAEGSPLNQDTGPPAPKSNIPNEKDVDQMFDYVEGMLRKFRERIDRLEKEKTDEGRPL